MKTPEQTVAALGDAEWVAQKTTGIPHIIYHAVHSCTLTLKEMFPVWCKEVIVFSKNEYLEWVYTASDLLRIGRYLFEQAKKDPAFIEEFQKTWENLFDDCMKIYRTIDNTDLQKLTNEELLRLYKQFSDRYQREYSLSMLCDHFGYFAEKKLSGKLTGEQQRLLTTPAVTSYMMEEEMDLLDVYFTLNPDIPVREAVLQSSALKKKILEHAKKYFWIQNTYKFGRILDEGFFLERLEEFREKKMKMEKLKRMRRYSDTVRKQKDQLVKISNLDDDVVLLMNLIDVFAKIHDKRKKANVLASHYVHLFMQEVASRTAISLESLKYVMPDEVASLFEQGVNTEMITARQKNWAIYFVDGELGTLNADDADELHKAVFGEETQDGPLKGICASPGSVRGKVKIILHSTQANKLDKGDILVASMTRPDYMTAIKKAAAIVTDEGGVTCHAAIVSREMNIPCVIATKHATKLLKDGDMVEVDADQGLVKKV